VFIYLSEQHNYLDLYTDFCSFLLHASAVYLSHHQVVIQVHKKRLQRETDLSLQRVGIRLFENYDYYSETSIIIDINNN